MKRPNILLILTDMQRADTIRAHGNNIIQTPNLDRLAGEGTSFSRCYTPSPVCVPARCCMHYGQYPQQTGLFTNGTMMPDNGKSVAAQLSNIGYQSISIGKCHFTPDPYERRGFTERILQEERATDYSRDDYRASLMQKNLNPVEAHGERGPMYYIPQPSRFQGDDHPTEWIANRTIEKMSEYEEEDKPWFIMSSFIHPHPPLTPPLPWTKLYPPDDMPPPVIPENSDELLTHINRTQNRYKWRDNGRDLNLERTIKSYYYATISFIDYQVGRILQHLEQENILDDTLIIFTSDHGEYLGDYNCYGKRSMHDASSRVPLIVRKPGLFAAGASSNTPVSLIDILPTAVCAAGASPEATDGEDLAKIASGDVDRNHVYSQWGKGRNAIYMVASETWKYIYSAGDALELLFEKSTDPKEVQNRAKDPKAQSTKQELEQVLLKYLSEQGDDEAITEGPHGPEWKEHPRLQQNYLTLDPDEGLLYQDEPEGLPSHIGEYSFPSRKFEENFNQRMFYGD